MHQQLQTLLNLKYEYNITNTLNFANNISKLKLNPEHKLLTMDIKDLYVNIPINDVIHITNDSLIQNHIDKTTKDEIIKILQMILNQNYFQYNDKFYKPNSGVAMGSPLSSLMAEVFLQHFEQRKVKLLLEDKRIIYYNRYVDDIIMIYNRSKITPQYILDQFNKQNNNLQFTLNEEDNNQITYLDLQLTNNHGQVRMEIFRKPTSTDTTINNKSCHPKEQKLAAYKNWIHRLSILPMDNAAKNKELNIIINIAENNGYNKELITRMYHKRQQQKTKGPIERREQKWVSYTYNGNYTRKITKLFKNTNVRIAFKVNHTLGKILNQKQSINSYEQSGIYKLTCQECQQVYIGQTGRKLITRYNEHIRSIRFNKNDSAYAQHILNRQHQYGPISQIMELIEVARKGKLMNIKEEYQIYRHYRENKLIDEQKQAKEINNQNSMFDLITTCINTPTTTS
ncbi:uncharacterized protein LOC111874349 [Cryptotermes secundus]|uniref:uncharacterized protein LOC111874349 n=1 Tax=Cryptotermes secundus TaxID=105785 RepID=UPI000CD7C778|nr:uncharacterized protein LOC111874349 [Cryptotermes secundus]